MSDVQNATDRKAIAAAKKRAKDDEIRKRNILRQIMGQADGRLWMWDQLAEGNVFSSTFTHDALVTAFNEGRRSVALALMSDVMATCPSDFMRMIEEANERRTRSPDPASDTLAERSGSEGIRRDPEASSFDEPGDPEDA